MPIVSEKAASRQNVKSSIASQFWEQPVHSTKSLDGQLWSLPCEPPALNLTGSSGLSRTQQLLAAQAVRVPFFPSYDGASDGVVGAAWGEWSGCMATVLHSMRARQSGAGLLIACAAAHPRAVITVHFSPACPSSSWPGAGPRDCQGGRAPLVDHAERARQGAARL